MSERVSTLIVGGGIAGTALAHYLAEEGEQGILLVEADELGSGSTGGSFGGVRQQFSTPLEIELSRRGLEFWRTAERVFDSPVPWHQNGYLFMSGNPDIVAKLAEAAALQRSMGLTDVHVLDVEQVKELTPWVGTGGLLGAVYTPQDGKVTPTDGVAALAKAARARGVRIQEHWDVKSIERSGSDWRVTGPEVVEAERVVLCTGYWSTNLLRAFGLELTIRPVPLYAAITEPALEGQLVPLSIDLDTGLLIERESGGLLIAVLLEENPPGYGHAQMLDDFADLARVRAPSLADVKIAKHVVANVDLGGDGHPYVGQVEDGLWMIAGFGGHGVMHAPPVARLLAKVIAGRPDPTLDISELDPRRKPGSASEWMVASKKG
ncbi:MAG TPA: FAD-binding oxidoreductase [Candidatus Dormibacteraeota bacterium]|nr:FAD-binding oxidoreductase [Candidatus Dormibacteraeota bacterium]